MNFGIDELLKTIEPVLHPISSRLMTLKSLYLANYVFHRKVILDILHKAICRGQDGKMLGRTY